MTPKQIKALLPKKREQGSSDDFNTLMTRKELSRYFKVSPDAIAHYAKKKSLAAIPVEVETPNNGGRQTMIHHRLSDFAAWRPMRYRNSEWHQ